MKAIAVALPLLVATVMGGPASARPIDLTAMNGQLVISIGKADQVERHGWDHRKGPKQYGKQHRYEPLSPRQIARIVRNQGYYDLDDMRIAGRVYTVKARGPRGALVRLTVSARDGDIIDRQILRRPHTVDRRAYDRGFDRGFYRGYPREYDRDGRHDNRSPFWIR